MVSLVRKLLHQSQFKKNLFALLAEMEKNLEIFYVAQQRQFITQPFLTQAWEILQPDADVRKHEAIVLYAGAIADFNRLFKEQKEYEQWYVSDLKNKTPENARKLHALKHELGQKLNKMEAAIIPAGQALEKEMIQMGLLK